MSDRIPYRPTSGLSSFSGQARTQLPHRSHNPMNRPSDIAPGGRSGLPPSAHARRSAKVEPTAPTPTARTDRRRIPTTPLTRPARSDVPRRRHRHPTPVSKSCVAPSGQTLLHHDPGHSTVITTINKRTAATNAAADNEPCQGNPTMLPNMESGSVHSSRG